MVKRFEEIEVIDGLVDRKRRLVVLKDRLAVNLRIDPSKRQSSFSNIKILRLIIKIPRSIIQMAGLRIYRVIKVENMIGDR